MIYTGYSELDMMNSHIRNDYDCWFAQWYSKPSSYKYNRLGMWQYGGETNYIDNPSIPGVGIIDQNLCYKDYPTIIKEGGYNGFKKSSSNTNNNSTTPSSTTKITPPSIYIQGVANGRQLGVIKDCADYSGILGKALVALAAKVSNGTIEYSVHLKGGSWLDTVNGFNYQDYDNGYAGSGNPAEKGKPIDAIKMYYKTPSDVIKAYGYYKVAYRVHLLGGSWLEWQYDTETTNGQDGYAGIIGKTIDGIEAKLIQD